MSSILEGILQTEVKNWEFIGHPALLQRFVLRNGKPYRPIRRIGRAGIPKQCFMNATKAVERHGSGWSYVEGFAIHREQPIMAFHHAWITTDGESAMDPTLNAHEYDYFGVAFHRDTMIAEMEDRDFYGLFDTGFGMDVKLMFRMDPDLKAIVQAVKPSAAWTRANEIMKEQAHD